MKTIKHKFTKEDIGNLMGLYNKKNPEEALEEWAYREYDLKHNASLTLGRIGKTFIEIQEVA